MKKLFVALLLNLLICLPAWGQTGPLPGSLSEDNFAEHLGVALAQNPAWTLHKKQTESGNFLTSTYAFSETAGCIAVSDSRTRKVMKLYFYVVKNTRLFRENAHDVYKGEIDMAIRVAANLFMHMEEGGPLEQEALENLSLRNEAIVKGKTIVARPPEAAVEFAARLNGEQYILEIVSRV